MADELLATNRFPGDGVTTQFLITFAGGYIDRAHVRAFIEDDATRARLSEITITPGMWIDDTSINLGVAAALGQNMLLVRDTPKDEPLVNFTTRSRITEANLDKLAQQAVFSSAEAFDRVGTAAEAASISATTAEAAQIAAAVSQAASAASQLAAADSASAASTSASASASSASAASASATSASSSSTAASNSSTAAGNSATAASNSASSAAASASTATTQAGIATTQAGIATAQATSASNSSSSALAAKSAAEAARDATLAAFDSFDDRYLGDKATDPTVDNDGQPLVAGAIYFNTGNSEMRVYTGSAWVAAYVSGTGFVTLSTDQTITGLKTFSQPVAASVTGSAAKLTTPRTLSTSGDVTWTSPGFDGSANVTAAATLANSGVVAGAYGGNNSIPTITVDAKGRVTSATATTPSGTYNINVSGNAATASNAALLDGIDSTQFARTDAIPVFAGGAAGSEGGEIGLAKPPSGTSLTGNVAIDINGNSLRVFAQTAGPTVGVQVDLNAQGGISSLITSQNIGSQSVNYAATAGVAASTSAVSYESRILSASVGEEFTPPASVQDIEFTLYAVGTSGSTDLRVQFFVSGAWVTAGYLSYASGGNGGVSTNSATNGFRPQHVTLTSSARITGTLRLSRAGAASNKWVSSGQLFDAVGAGSFIVHAGYIDLAADITRVRFIDTGGVNVLNTGVIRAKYSK